MANLQFNLKECEISIKNKGNIKIFPGKQKLITCQQKHLTVRNTKENTIDRRKIIPDKSTEAKEEMKITEQDKDGAKSKWILIVIRNDDHVSCWLICVYKIKDKNNTRNKMN